MAGVIAPWATIIISLLAFFVSFATLWNNSKKDEGENKAANARVITELGFISNDLKEIKAEYRTTQNELKDVREIAEHASERAEAAHRRLDRAKIDIN